MFQDRWPKGMADVLISSTKSNSVKQFYKSRREMKVRDGKWGTHGISNNHRPKVSTNTSDVGANVVSKRRTRAFHRNYYFGRTTHTESVRNPQAVHTVGAYDVRTIQRRNLGLTQLVQSLSAALISVESTAVSFQHVIAN